MPPGDDGPPEYRGRVEVRRVDHQRSDHRLATAGLRELHAVELRVGEAELDDGRKLSQLPAAQPDLRPELWHPPLDELRRADVVVVDELQARMRDDCLRCRRADRGLVAHPLALGLVTWELRKRVNPTGQTRPHAAGVDLRDESHRVQNALGLQCVVADGITLDDGGNDLVDSNRSDRHAPPSTAKMAGAGRCADTAKTSASLASGSNTANTDSP